jgi:hypothetical protein
VAGGAMSIEEVADAIRRAGADRDRMRRTMSGLYADTIELAHEPPLPSDGPMPGSVLIALGGEEVAAVERAMPDVWMDEPAVTVEGDHIRVRNRMGGTLAGGAEVRVSTNTVYAIDEGRIVGLRSEMAPDDVQQWGAVLSAGSFQVPPELFPLDRPAP